MMKYQVLFVLLAVLTANGRCSKVELEELQYLEEITPKSLSTDEGPVDIIESYEEINFDNDSLAAKSSLLYRGVFIRNAVANTVLIHRVTYNGRSTTRISSVRGAQIGSNQGASAYVIAGGVGSNSATVEIRSQRGRGFHVQIDILGRL